MLEIVPDQLGVYSKLDHWKNMWSLQTMVIPIQIIKAQSQEQSRIEIVQNEKGYYE